MNSKRILTFLFCVLLALGMVPAAQAKDMTATVSTGPVVMNGQTIDSSAAQYPLLVYKSITYVPMTYDLCRFMGLTTEWDNDTKTLSINKSQEQGPYVPDTGGSRRGGSVSVTRVVHPVTVCGVPIDNTVEAHPLFLYHGVTYFPLTFDYITAAFGWTYTWSMTDGLNIRSLPRPALPSEAVDTGDPALDAALETLNRAYRQSRIYSGTLTDRQAGTAQDFEASVTVVPDFIFTNVVLRAKPFVFFENGDQVFMHYHNESGLTGEPGFGTGGHFISDTPGTLHAPPYNSNTEAGYIAMCFLDCQFSGARTRKIQSASQERQGDLTTWHLQVALAENGFTEYNAALTIDESRDAVAAIEIETVNYTLRMTPKV